MVVAVLSACNLTPTLHVELVGEGTLRSEPAGITCSGTRCTMPLETRPTRLFA